MLTRLSRRLARTGHRNAARLAHVGHRRLARTSYRDDWSKGQTAVLRRLRVRCAVRARVCERCLLCRAAGTMGTRAKTGRMAMLCTRRR